MTPKIRNHKFSRPIILLLFFFSIIFVIEILSSVIGAPNLASYTDNRMLLGFKFLHGEKIYHSLDLGPVSSTVYGPMMFIPYLPALLMATPSAALSFATAISLFIFFGSLFIYLKYLSLELRPSAKEIVVGLLFMGFVTYNSWAMVYSAILIHADSPALGLGLLAVGFLNLYFSKKDLNLLICSGVLAALSIGAKQVMLPVFFLILFILLLSPQKKKVGYFLFPFLIIAGGLFAIALYCSDSFHDLWFQLVKYKMVQPTVRSFGEAYLDLRSVALTPLLLNAIPIAAGLSKFGFHFFSRATLRLLWAQFFILAILITPLTFWAYIKMGAGINTYSFTEFFLWVSCLTYFLGHREEGRKLYLPMLILMMAIIGAIRVPRAYQDFKTLLGGPDGVETLAFQYAQKYPKQVYFPSLPLVTAFTDGVAYHHDRSAADRNLSGLPLTPEHFKRYIPANLNRVAFTSDYTDGEILRFMNMFLPEYKIRIEEKDLPGFKVFLKAP